MSDATKDLVEEFRQKARCRHCSVRTMALWRVLRERLSPDKLDRLTVACARMTAEGSPAVLDETVDQLLGRHAS